MNSGRRVGGEASVDGGCGRRPVSRWWLVNLPGDSGREEGGKLIRYGSDDVAPRPGRRIGILRPRVEHASVIVISRSG